MNDDELIRCYLLGELPEEEQARVQDRLVADRALLTALESGENQLLDEFARGELSGRERERFSNYFLASPERGERLRFALALNRYVLEASQSEARLTPFPSRLHFRSTAMKWAVAAAAVLVIAAGALLAAETIRLRNQLEALRAEQAQLQNGRMDLERQVAELRSRNQELSQQLDETQRLNVTERAPQSDSGPGWVLSFALASGLTREDARTTRVEIPEGPGQVRLQLELEQDLPGSYRAELRTAGGNILLSKANLSVQRSTRGKVVIITLSARRLATGDYILALFRKPRGQEYERAGTYHFRVLRKAAGRPQSPK